MRVVGFSTLGLLYPPLIYVSSIQQINAVSILVFAGRRPAARSRGVWVNEGVCVCATKVRDPNECAHRIADPKTTAQTWLYFSTPNVGQPAPHLLARQPRREPWDTG